MKKSSKNPITVRRNIVWLKETDDTAVQLAQTRGYYPEKRNGGVSKLLADLVRAV